MYFLFIDNLATARITIVILLVMLIVAALLALYFAGFFAKAGFRSFSLEPIDNDITKHNIRLYRNRISILKDTGGIFYTKQDVEKYINTTFSQLTDKMVGDKNCEWVVGFYPMFCKDKDERTRLSIFIAPTPAQVSTDKATGKKTIVSIEADIFEALNLKKEEIKNSPYRQKPDNNDSKVTDDNLLSNIAYDSGHMYP
jgi:hypothetical protein